MHREVSRLDWLPADSAAVVALAESCGIAPAADPSATLAALSEAATRLGRSLPRLGATRVHSALQAPTLVSLDSLPSGPEEVADPRTLPGGGPTVDEQAGWTTAAVGHLVSNDPELVGLAVHGDSRALRKIGDQVLAALGGGSEGHRLTRQRCWDEFQHSGRLFTTEAGVERFGSLVSNTSLAAIDESLRRAMGLRPAAADE